MPWLELRIDATEKQVTQYEELLEKAGALAVTYADAGDQPILEPEAGTMPLWSEVVVVGLFDTSANPATIEACVRDLNTNANLLWNILEDRVWEREWLQHHQPQKFGNAFWVYSERVNDNLPTLLLDPGLAFGTGTHPTTALCLEWIAQQSLQDKVIVDFGCGSGILALAALLQGAQSAICLDIDAQALQATRNNAQRNHIDDRKLGVYFPDSEPKDKSDVLFANILAGPIKQLADCFASKILTDGKICLSGILQEQEKEIVEQYYPWFDNIQTECKDDWIRITGIRNQLPVVEESVIEKQAS